MISSSSSISIIVRLDGGLGQLRVQAVQAAAVTGAKLRHRDAWGAALYNNVLNP